MNTKFVYLYRDGANYKKWGGVVFEGKPSEKLEERIRRACVNNNNFIAGKVDIPTVFLYEDYEFDRDIDHDWHEFNELVETDEEPTDDRTIKQFVQQFEEVDHTAK